MINCGLKETTTCHIYKEEIERGILIYLKHHKEKHDLHETTKAFIKARELKGSALTIEDLDELKK